MYVQIETRVTKIDVVETTTTSTKRDKQLTMILRRANSLLQRFPTANWEHIYSRLCNADDIEVETNTIVDELDVRLF